MKKVCLDLIKINLAIMFVIGIDVSCSFEINNSTEDFNFFNLNKNNLIVENSNSDIYQQISNEFDLEYQRIGKEESNRVLSNSGLSITGGVNSVGISYRKPFINFAVILDRNLAPDIYDDKRWIVTDTFSVEIDASRYIGNLRNQSVLDLTEENYAAFAGLTFKRKFTWVHFANSYVDGLTKNFEKLFMPFKVLKLKHLMQLGDNEIIFREDLISFKAGGLVSAPIYPGISGSAAALVKFTRISGLEITSLAGTQEILISSTKEKLRSVGVSAAVQADFMKILKLTLLSYDFNYELESSNKIYLSFNKTKLLDIEENYPEVVKQINRILINKDADLDLISPYLISEERRRAERFTHKYNFLLLGKIKESKTQQIEISKEGKLKTIFRHTFEKIKYTENLISKLFAGIVYALTQTELKTGVLASDTRSLRLEYDSERNLLDKKEDLAIEENNGPNEKLSLSFEVKFVSNKTKGKIGKSYKRRAQYYFENFPIVKIGRWNNQDISDLIAKNELIAPIEIEGKYQVGLEGVHYFNQLEFDEVLTAISNLCQEYPKNKFINLRNIFDHCKKSIQDDYIKYYSDLSHDRIENNEVEMCYKESKKFLFLPGKKRKFIKTCLSAINHLSKQNNYKLPLWSLKKFVNNIIDKSYSHVDVYRMFGEENVFFNGSIEARTKEGFDFTTAFHRGNFKGLGVVDHYMRTEKLRSPASIFIDTN